VARCEAANAPIGKLTAPQAEPADRAGRMRNRGSSIRTVSGGLPTLGWRR
jgi:hypothetical protein